MCRAKHNGGLGIRKAKDTNTGLLAKLGWRIMTEKIPLWIQLLHKKYLKYHCFKDWPTKRKASHVWRSIIKTRSIVLNNLKWLGGNGENISFWNNWWCGATNLADSLNISNSDQSLVADFITTAKDWNVTLINQVVNVNVVDAISNVLIPKVANVDDTLCWTLSSNGNFSVKSAYNHNTSSPLSTIKWKWI